MRFFTYVMMSALLAACGQVSYKMGGNTRDIELAHQACRGSGEQFAQCLEKHGWQQPQADLFDPLFATITATDNRNPDPNKPALVLDINPDKTTAAAPAKTAESVAETTKTSGKPAVVATTDTAQAQRSTVNDGPDVEYAINSWWKMGAFPDQLARDQRSCEKKMGPQYLPDYKTQTFKRAFIVCMHDLGWMAVRNYK